jgi:hypothetical protein
LLIIIGTSLQVQPFASLIDDVLDTVPRLLINKDEVGVHKSKASGFDFKWKYGLNRDVFHSGACDDGVTKLAELLGWEKDLDRLYNKGTEKLKATYLAAVEAEEAEAKKEEIEPAAEQREDKEVDELAGELEKLTAKDVKEEAVTKQIA